MELKPGYKQTEVGLIPRDWDVSTVGNLFRITAGGDVDRKRSQSFFDEVYRYPIYSNALTNLGLYGYCSYADHPKGSLTITARGMVGHANFRDHDYTAIGRVLVLQPNVKVAGVYFAELINNTINFADESTGVPQLTAPQISKYQLPVPSFPEQQAIAEALSDADALIESLDQLIAKKRQIKQGAMQELLTGKRRLPGFSGEWEVVQAGDIGYFKGGSGFPTRFQGGKSGEYPFYKVSDMNIEGNEIFMKNANNYIDDGLRRQVGATSFPANSIVFAKVGAAVFLERKKILSQASCLDNNMAALILDDTRADFRFIHFVLLNKNLGNLVSATALPSLSNSVLATIELVLPPRAEQTAIATILSDMDCELAALESRLAKARKIKQGMMHELLTGRIRLI